MTAYPQRIENYGPNGLIDVQTPSLVLTGEDEQRYLAPDKLKAAYTTLRQWSADAAQVNTDWDTMTAGQKDAAMQETIRRLGIFMDRLADLLLMDGKS